MKWQVDIVIAEATEPSNINAWKTREINLEIEATTSRDAAQRALIQLELKQDELLHTLFIHLGKPQGGDAK